MPRQFNLMSLYTKGDGKADFAELITRQEGNLCRIAWELAVHRRTAYRMIWRAKLWRVVNEARARRKRARQPEWLHATREALRV